MSMGSPTYLFDQLIFREIRERAVPVQNPRLQEPQPIEQSQAAESQWHQDCWIHRALGLHVISGRSRQKRYVAAGGQYRKRYDRAKRNLWTKREKM